MSSFFADLAVNPFLASGLAAGVLASVACGVTGPYVVSQRLVFLAAAIAHIAIGGVGAAIFLRHRFPDALELLQPLHGALAAAVAAAVALAYLYERVRERLDTLVGALWAAGMAAGILMVKLTPGYQPELMSYLFGNIAYVSWESVRMIVILDLVIVAATVVMHKRFLALCLDPEQVELQGLSVLGTRTVLLLLVALTVVCLTLVVGLILVIALLSLPAAAAARSFTRLPSVIWGSIGLCAVLTTAPRVLVYGSPISPEPAIVLAAGLAYACALGWSSISRA